jgi:RNA polymerase sigma-70 factor (ECF subfamily)
MPKGGRGEPAAPADPEDDAALVAGVVSGSVEALAALYDRHAASMLGVAARVLGDRRDAEDLLHDVFLEVWSRSASYEPKRASVRAWLLVKVRSRAIDRLRSLGVARRHGLGADGYDASEVEDVDAALGVLRSVDRSRALAVLASLPETHRSVVQMMYLDGYTCSEIARRASLPLGTVKSRLARGLALLRERLPECEGGVD